MAPSLIGCWAVFVYKLYVILDDTVANHLMLWPLASWELAPGALGPCPDWHVAHPGCACGLLPIVHLRAWPLCLVLHPGRDVLCWPVASCVLPADLACSQQQLLVVALHLLHCPCSLLRPLDSPMRRHPLTSL